ncbi:MAG: hypothetical protein ACT4P7_02390 [Gemmatimonadaceae bacterium]
MAAYKTRQRFLRYRKTEYHFVSYEGQAANPKKALLATPPTWYLMKAGKRWAVMEEVPGMPEAELDKLLIEWLNERGFPAASSLVPLDAGSTSRRVRFGEPAELGEPDVTTKGSSRAAV